MTIPVIRNKVKNLYDILRLRIAMANRQTKVNATIHLDQADLEFFLRQAEHMMLLEKEAEAAVKDCVEAHPLWKTFLEPIKGIGTRMAGVILSEFDIHRGSTVSKFWAVCGIGQETQWTVTYRDRKALTQSVKVPDMSPKGKARKTKDGVLKFKNEKQPKLDDQGQLEYGKWSDWATVEVWATSENSAQGVVPKHRDVKVDREFKDITRISEKHESQKLRSGQYPSYNAWLKTKMVGVLADSFVKQQTPKYITLYYDYKTRCESQGVGVGKRWKSKGHVHRASCRYMIKMFLADLYNAWRPLEGLSVRPPYQEEYLGHKHEAEPATAETL